PAKHRPRSADTSSQRDRDAAREQMFVEGVRLFVVVLGTAIGFWVDRAAGGNGGVGGRLGCLLGYVTGGFFGRLIERALGAVERRVDTKSPAQFIAGTLGAIVG